MGKIVSAMALSHAPGLLSLPDGPPKEQMDRMKATLDEMKKQLDVAKPDVIIAFLDDHFENFFRTCMPTFCVGIGDEAYGPMKEHLKWLKMKEQVKVPSHADYAMEIFNATQQEGIELSRTYKWQYGQNLMAPLEYIRNQYDIPVIPVFINVFTPPVATTERVYELGQCIRKVIEKRPENVALLATGALSHWPPYWQENSPNDDMMHRMYRYQTDGVSVLEDDPKLFVDFGIYEEEMFKSGKKLINPEWDQEILDVFERGDVNRIKKMTAEDIVKGGGHGGLEILNWIALMGAMNGAKSRTLLRENVLEWICGMGFITYDLK
jgi:2,3-dihydroxyphenylpropionate 1,2-dioxygenase